MCLIKKKCKGYLQELHFISITVSFFFCTFFRAKFGLAALQTDAGEESLCKWPINVLDCCSVNGAPHPVSHQKSPSA